MEHQIKRVTRRVFLPLLLVLGASQLIQPGKVNPPVAPERSVWNDQRVDARVGGILRRACADCHSHETKWPWYSHISPISWLVVRHVEQGRAKLNFSDWGGPSSDQLEEIYDSVAKNKMPLPSYVLIHPDARLSQGDREILTAWADGKLGGNPR